MLRLLCLVLAACALSAGGAPVAAVGNKTFDTIADALKEDDGLIVLLSDVSGSLPVNVKTAFWGGPENPVTLDLAGHTITGTDASKPVIENNGDLTIIDSVGGGKITRNVAATDSGGGIKNYGTLTFAGGMITGCDTAGDGGGIMNYATLVFSGGSIVDCNSRYGAGISNSGGVNSKNADLTMTGGTIKGCVARADGGGIYACYTTRISGGEICDCIASSGGAIKIELGTHSISGGRFSGSIAFNRGTFNLTGGLYDDVAAQGTAVTRHVSKGYEIVVNDDPQTATSYGWKIAKIDPPPDPPPQPPPEQPEEKGYGFLLILR